MKASLDDHEVVTTLCSRIASGESILAICKAKDMPAARTVYARMAENDEFRASIARAREAQQEYEADRCVEMADEATLEDWQLVKLRIWARQWRASKLAPRKYGDKPVADAAQSKPDEPARLPDGRLPPLIPPFKRADQTEVAPATNGGHPPLIEPFYRSGS